MCAIMTVSKDFWNKNRAETIARIKADAVSNSDGISVTLLGHKADSDLSLTAMDVNVLLPTITVWMDDAGEDARMFVHQRMATTSYVGVAFNHGFVDGRGGIIMHNGILRSEYARSLRVDSYALMRAKAGHEDALVELMLQRETYGNIFRIYPNEHSYEVLRLSVGSLYTDGQGNFSTNRFAAINSPVKEFTAEKFEMPGRREASARKSYFHDWTNPAKGYESPDSRSSYESAHERGSYEGRGSYNRGYLGDDFEEAYEDTLPWWTKTKASNPAESAQEVIAEDDNFIVLLDDEMDEVVCYRKSTWAFMDFRACTAATTSSIGKALLRAVAGEKEETLKERADDLYELSPGESIVAQDEDAFVVLCSETEYLYLHSMVDGTLLSSSRLISGDTDWQGRELLKKFKSVV